MAIALQCKPSLNRVDGKLRCFYLLRWQGELETEAKSGPTCRFATRTRCGAFLIMRAERVPTRAKRFH